MDADGGAGGFGSFELDLAGGGGVAGILVEDEVVGFEVNWLLQLGRGRLVGTFAAFGIGFEIDEDAAFGDNVAGGGIEFKVFSGDAIEAAGIFAIDDDLDVVEFGSIALFELHGLGGADRELGAALLGFGDGKALGGLLNVDAELGWDLVDGFADAPARVEIHAGYDGDHQNRARGKPRTQAGDG